MSYIGSTPTSQAFAPGTDTFNGDGTTVTFTLNRNVSTVNDILVVVNNVEQQPSNYTVSGNTLTFSPAPSSGTNNIYVRYLSTNLQSVAPQQGSVYPSSLSTGGPTWDTLNNISVANTFGFKNRIINGDMRIDQRNAGASVTPTTTTNGFPVDRFQVSVTQNSKLTTQQSSTAATGFSNSLLVTSSSAYSITSSDVFSIRQSIEGFNFADLAFGTASAVPVTLSFWVRSSLTGTFGGSLTNYAATRSYPFTYTISVANTWEQKTITIARDTSGTWVGATNAGAASLWFGLGVGSTSSGTAGAWAGADYRSATGATSVVGTNGATFYITGVQLEKGSTATSFDFRDYGRELILCQRYYQIVGQVITTTSFYSTVSYLQQMRTFPSIGPVTFDAGTGATFLNMNVSNAASQTKAYQNTNHSQIAQANIPLSAEL